MINAKTKIAAFAATTFLLAGTALPAFADDATPAPSTSPNPWKQEGQTLRGEIKTLRADIATTRQTIRSDRGKFHAMILQRHFNFYAARLQNIATRVQNNINTQKSKGKDVTTAQSQLDTANATLKTAIADGQTAVSMFNNITVSAWNVQQPQIKAAIDQAQKARSEFVQARLQLLTVVQTLLALK
ncbi:hypothetical protein C5B42_05190 [Candidatus Cerribacteria bacterium 'Amazon FNV 2010 28 9']|uniref:DUF5667 domain-containing protein n=1 Tax=Candidatus Cerribacteria bacterium 'Amazon FNV 2010 28 9' TaxID=2081795 RepID=A0A317JQ67_9BACT|nr:MAG: hypothetical protein C5B42_05190 [Candidatus Cerribacteria bacterium 'Amazon FNV 2010 28 9']